MGSMRAALEAAEARTNGRNQWSPYGGAWRGNGLREIDSANFNSAEDMNRALLRDQWEDYKERFYPREEELGNFALSGEPIKNTLSRVADSFDTGATLAAQSQARDLQSYGLSETPRQRMAREKVNTIENSAAKVSGLNKARLHVQDSQNKVLSGSGAVGLKEYMVGDKA